VGKGRLLTNAEKNVHLFLFFPSFFISRHAGLQWVTTSPSAIHTVTVSLSHLNKAVPETSTAATARYIRYIFIFAKNTLIVHRFQCFCALCYLSKWSQIFKIKRAINT